MKLSHKQKQMVQDAIGDGTACPKFTDDPLVNHRVDMLVCACPSWDELSEEEQQLYYEEVKMTAGRL